MFDTIRGCLLGGAIGDALGYPIEFDTYETIQKKYGTLDHYILENGKALISDDTQMTLFTANGIIFGDTRTRMRSIGANPHVYVYNAYLDWLHTQTKADCPKQSWILNHEELYALRAPGNTCLNALKSGEKGTIEKPINNSKGCGGIMRVAPLALYYREANEQSLDMEAARVAAITHGHALGYMPAAALNHILLCIIKNKEKENFDLYDVMEETMNVMKELFKGNPYLDILIDGMQKAIDLSKNKMSDIENIKQLGEGWVAEEAFFISMYCALKYSNNFDAAIIAAVNHSGDSDSTGAITGNIVGALNGFQSISSKWLDNLECKDLLLEMADDLYNRCQMSEYSLYKDQKWMDKYIYVKGLD